MKKKLKEVLESILAEKRENKHETRIEISNGAIICTSETMGYGGLIFYLLLIFLPSGYLAGSTADWFNKPLSIIWFVLFFHQFYDIVKGEVKLCVNISAKVLNVHSNNLLQTKYNLPGIFSKQWVEKSISFNKIKEIKLKSTNRYRYAHEETQIYAITDENRKVLLTEFKEEFTAKRFAFVLKEVLAGRHL